MKVALSALLVLAVVGATAHAQTQRLNSDFSTMQDSGPPVAGGNGATVGPNWKNQATSPMPGSEVSELPRDRDILFPESTITINPQQPAPPAKKPPPRAQE